MPIKTTELIRTSQTWDGATLPDFPQGKPELRVVRLDFPVGAKTGWHHHPVINYGIVQQGDLTIVCRDGNEKTFHEGEALVEVIGTIHRGENRGSKPVILDMFYFSSPSAEITIQHPELDNRQDIISERQEKVLRYLEQHHIPFTTYNHPEGKTIEEAKRWWHDDGSVHCKNIFMRNHKGDRHYLICFPCDDDLAIHDIEHWLKDILVAQGQKAPGKLSFASPERMMRYLGLEPGSVSPFGLINDTDHHVILFLDSRLKDAPYLSFHPNDCRGTVVISQEAFQQFLASVGNHVEYI